MPNRTQSLDFELVRSSSTDTGDETIFGLHFEVLVAWLGPPIRVLNTQALHRCTVLIDL